MDYPHRGNRGAHKFGADDRSEENRSQHLVWPVDGRFWIFYSGLVRPDSGL